MAVGRALRGHDFSHGKLLGIPALGLPPAPLAHEAGPPLSVMVLMSTLTEALRIILEKKIGVLTWSFPHQDVLLLTLCMTEIKT